MRVANRDQLSLYLSYALLHGVSYRMNDTDLQTPQLYINRELSFLEFNQRVLEQAKDSRIPLLERVRIPVHLLRQPR